MVERSAPLLFPAEQSGDFISTAIPHVEEDDLRRSPL
jgi:hypothetical protein